MTGLGDTVVEYYRLRSVIRQWGRGTVHLNLSWGEGFPPINIVCTPLRDRLPPQLLYRLTPARAPLTDVMWSASKYDLYSPRAIALLNDFGAD